MRRKRLPGFFVSMRMTYLILIPTIFHLIITVWFFFSERDDAPCIYLVGGEKPSSPSRPEGEGIGSRRESSPLCVVDARMTASYVLSCSA